MLDAAAEDPAVERWTEHITRVLAPNPGPMTLEGTNTLVVRAPGAGRGIVVDPGPADPDHRRRILGLGPIGLILVTHGHLDHVEGAPELAERSGAPVRALDPAHSRGAPPLVDGEVFELDGTSVEVLATPGHTLDSVCFVLGADRALEGGAAGTVLTGDTILGRGSTVLAGGPTAIADSDAALGRLAALGPMAAAPGHGPRIHDVAATAGMLREHRRQRLRQVQAAAHELGLGDRVDAEAVALVADRVYADIDEAVRFAARLSVEAQLRHLAGR